MPSPTAEIPTRLVVSVIDIPVLREGRAMIPIRAWIGAVLAGPALVTGMPLGAQQPAARDSLPASEAEYEGWKRYHLFCDRCHGPDAAGSTFAPDLRRSVAEGGSMTPEAFQAVVRDGRVDKGMPGFAPLLTAREIEQIYAYVQARSEGRLGPGRPRRTPQP
ncbi:MAG TPA: c-type cytochrome [Gemmatimonadales bacterium]|nr:c-type cytochrome [Gemmatimonadales bacterium]